MWWTASQPHFSLFLLVQKFKPEICEAYLSREEFHREKHYDFCSKQVPLWCLQMFVSRTLRRLSSSHSKKHEKCFKQIHDFRYCNAGVIGLHHLPTFSLSTWRPSGQGKAQVDSTVEVGGKSPALRNCVACARPWRSRVQMRIGLRWDRPPHRRWQSEPRDAGVIFERSWLYTPVAQLAERLVYFIRILVQYRINMLHLSCVFFKHNW